MSCQVPGTPRNSTLPRSSKPMPEPTTKSRTVLETRTSPGPAWPTIRAAMCTAIPPMPLSRGSLLAGVNASADLDTQCLGVRAQGLGAADGLRRAVERDEVAVARALHHRAAESGEDITLFGAGINRCIVLVHRGGPERAEGVELLMQVRARGLNKGFSGQGSPVADIYIASEKARSGDFDDAIGQIRQVVVDDFYGSGGSIWSGLATTVLVEALMARGADGDLAEAEAAIDRLAGVPTDPRFVLYEITLLRMRALLARAYGDMTGYRDYRDRYRAMATSLGYEGHMKWAEAMP